MTNSIDLNNYMEQLEAIQNDDSYKSSAYETLRNTTIPEIEVDVNKRKIIIPVDFTNAVVYNDHNALTLVFKVPRYFDDVDFSTKTCVIPFINPSGEQGLGVGVPVLVDTDYITVEWTITNNCTSSVGLLTFAMCFYSITDEIIDYQWSTTPVSLSVLRGLELIDGTFDIISATMYEEILSRITAHENASPTTHADGSITFEKLDTTLQELINSGGKIVGNLDDLQTSDKSNIINAINELDAELAEKANSTYVEEIQSQFESDLADEKRERADADNQFIGFVQTLSETINDVSEEINEESSLRQEADSEFALNMGNVEELQTYDKSSLVNAINELNTASEWKVIGGAQLTQDNIDAGATAITLDLGAPVTEWYEETIIRIIIPYNATNTANGHLKVMFGDTIEHSIGSLSEHTCAVYICQSPSYGAIPYKYSTIITLHSQWINKRLSHTILTQQAYASKAYPHTVWGADGGFRKIKNKRYLSLSSNNENAYKLPAETKIQLYGRL